MILFREKDHCYFDDETAEQFISCTTLLKKYEPIKDWKAISATYAKKHGKTAEYWQSEWNKTNTEAAEKGTEYHFSREDLYEKLAEEGKAVYMNRLRDGIKTSKDLSQLEVGIHSELILYSEEFGVAGQADFVEILPDKTVNINDFKTSKKIEFESYYNYKTGYEFMLSPLNYLHNTNGVKFQLQTSLYMYFLELQGFKPGKLSVEMVKEDNKIYELPYAKQEVINLLEHYKESKFNRTKIEVSRKDDSFNLNDFLN